MMIQRLYETVSSRGNVCAGLDSHPPLLPPSWAARHNDIYQAWLAFNLELVDALEDTVACFKIQIACYEAYGLRGLQVYRQTLDYIRSKPAILIADVKRNDIADTAALYARAHFEGDFEADFITLNPYPGMDSLIPYLPYIERQGKGIFVLVRTSNPGAADFQDLSTREGLLWQQVGEKIRRLGKSFPAPCGYSPIGAVVGCTDEKNAVAVRKFMPDTFFLIPGFGAQGGGPATAAALLKQGNGGVINSSRGIILAYRKQCREESFAESARLEAEKMKAAIINAGSEDK